MKERLNIGILFGGRSCEHEVSVTSTRSILKALDPERYNIHLVGIDKSGYWHLADDIEVIASSGSVKQLNYDQDADQGQHSDSDIPVSLGLHNHGNLTPQSGSSGTVLKPGSGSNVPQLDVVFPVLHGTFGEDGTVQGVLEMAGLPYVGCSVAASALAMDKALAKKIFESANIPQAPYVVATVFQWQEDRDRVISAIEEMLGYAVFVKPANLGSSVGVSKAKTRNELVTAIELALEFDRKVVVEMSMENCHEIECAILGNENPQASVLGEIIPGAEFYNYETKYIDDKSRSIIPAPLDAATTARVQALSIEAFKAIDGNGLARVDFFVHKDSGDIILNAVNTLPGFTPISMYPQLWAASGIPYPELIDRLIELAMENHRTKQSLKRAF
jgi:D-alanine-D-alanine ligase